MKRLITLSFIICFSHYFCYSQEFHKAVITDVNYFMRTSAYINKTYFPPYFHFPEFIADIHSDIAKFTKERFHTDTVIFLYPDSVSITQDWVAPNIMARDTAKKHKDDDVVFISVETILQEGSIVNGERIYYFITRIKAYRNGGKKVYKFKNQIPFTCYSGEEISGVTSMSENDFYTFYFDGLDLAFKGETPRVERRFIQKPQTSYYDIFLNEAEKFYLAQNNKGYTYGSDFDSMVEVLRYKTNLWQGFSNDFNLVTFLYNNMQKDGYDLHNTLKNEDYLIKITGIKGTLFDFLAASEDIIITINTRDNKKLGDFTYDNGKLEAELLGKSYLIKWNYKFNVVEITAADQPMALMKYLNDRRVIYIKNSITEEELGDLFNLIFFYDFADLVHQLVED